MTFSLPIAAIEAKAARRPAGYLAAVYALGRVEGDRITIDSAAYLQLVAAFDSSRVLVPSDVAAARQAQCDACPHWDAGTWFGTGGCRLCGCTRLKLHFAGQSCPDIPPRWTAF